MAIPPLEKSFHNDKVSPATLSMSNEPINTAALHAALKDILPEVIGEYLKQNSDSLLNLSKVLVDNAIKMVLAENFKAFKESIDSFLKNEIVAMLIANGRGQNSATVPDLSAMLIDLPKEYIEIEQKKISTFAKQHESWESHARCTLEYLYGSGLCCEFGVYMGGTIRFFASQLPSKTIHGFDSFEGLGEKWGRYEAGHLNLGKRPPIDLPSNVTLHVGWFEEALPAFAKVYTDEIAFMHIDCDLYSSTVTIFENLGHRLRPGSVIIFDEYLTRLAEGDECKAFLEFIQKSGRRYRYISCHKGHGSVSVLIE